MASGCISVEADIHLSDGDLLVGHSPSGLRKSVTLRNMYLEPLQRMLHECNANLPVQEDVWRGIFDSDTRKTLVLLVDYKSAKEQMFAELHSQLQPLRDLDYLTKWNGTHKAVRPLTIVVTGKAPFDSVLALPNDRRDIFWDAHLEALQSTIDDFSTDPPTYKYNQSNSHYASTQFRYAVIYRSPDESLRHPSTPREKDLAATQIEQAAARGLVSRYWDAPTHPPNLRESAWRYLLGAKIGLINMDDLGEVRDQARGWG